MKGLLTLFAIPFLLTINGWALKTLWLWFVVPVFGLPALSIPAAIGMGIIIGHLTNHNSTNSSREKDEDKIVENIVRAVLRPLFAVLFGWIVLQFM